MGEYDVSRRQILAGLAGTGSAGALAGSGTAALFADEKNLVDNFFSVGKLDLAVEWETDGMDGSSEGDASIPIDVTREKQEGSATLTVSLPGSTNNPAYGWLRVTCPDPAGATLAERLEATLAYDGSGEYLVGSDAVSLVDFADELVGGVPLSPDGDANVASGGQNCLRSTEEVTLVFDWELDPDEGYAGNESVSLTFEFVGRQCRNRTATNPFEESLSCDGPPDEPGRSGISYIEIFACDGDGEERLGKLELNDDYCGDQSGIGKSSIESGTYDLYPDDSSCDSDTDYDVYVENTETKDDGTETTAVEFSVLGPDGPDSNPELCRVDIKGGGGPPSEETVATYTREDGDLTMNGTDGLLYAPELSRGGGS